MVGIILAFLLVTLRIIYGLIIAEEAEENGLNGTQWFLGLLFGNRSYGEYRYNKLSNEVINEMNRIKQLEYDRQKVTDSVKEIESAIEDSKTTFFNPAYTTLIPLRSINTLITQYPTHKSIVLNVKGYTQSPLKIMATIQITSRNNSVSLLEDLIFDFDLAPIDQPLLSKEVQITLNPDYSIPDIEAIQVIEKKIIWADFTVTNVPVDSHQIITEPEKIAALAGFSGSDSVTTYAKRDLDWLCYCGEVNQNTLTICARCHRDASEFPEEGTYSAFIDHLITCETLLEAKELTTVYESTLTQPMFEKLKASIEKDIYIKKVYGMKNEKEKMKIYLAMLQNDLQPSVFSDNQSQ